MIIQTGIDLVEIDRLKRLRGEIRQRFIRRVLTEKEVQYAGDSLEHLAGCFAAKEAVLKTLGMGIGQVGWHNIEITHDEAGKPLLLLHEKAAESAQNLGLVTWSVSISHTRNYAVAMVVAIG